MNGVLIGCRIPDHDSRTARRSGVLTRQAAIEAQGAAQAPRFEVDPFWPKPLPNHWLLGNAIGVWVDARDQVWIVHRSSATLNNEKALELKKADCCAGAPPVLATTAGNLVKSWGGPGQGYRLAGVESRHLHRSHRQRVDRRQRSGRLPHHEVHAGRQVRGAVRQAEARDREGPKGSSAHAGQQRQIGNFGRVAKIFVDPKANEAYIADGYLNRRVAVLDAHRQHEALLGRVRQPAGRHAAGAVRSGRPARQAVPEPGALRRSRRWTASSTSATA